jgi:hypothetical protein
MFSYPVRSLRPSAIIVIAQKEVSDVSPEQNRKTFPQVLKRNYAGAFMSELKAPTPKISTD